MANVTVRIPTPLRSFTSGADQVAARGDTVGEVLRDLSYAHAGLKERILEPDGRLRNFVNLFVSSRNIRTLDGLDTAVAEGVVLSIVPAVAGGCSPRYPKFAINDPPNLSYRQRPSKHSYRLVTTGLQW